MGTLIFIIAFIIEAAFVAYRLFTQSNQPKVRSWIRLGALAGFALFTLVLVTRSEWSFRWYLLGALLLVWAALGAWTLVSQPAAPKDFRPVPVVVNALAALLLVALALTPALILPQAKLPAPTGPYPVATVTATYTDPSRLETFTQTGANRTVNVQFWYPQAAGEKFPLVVFSHGAFGLRTTNTSTFTQLASHGYVVCSIDHPYHSLVTKGADGRTVIVNSAFIQEVMGVNNGKYDEQTDLELEQKWLTLRAADINFVVDTILAHAQDAGSGPVYQLIQREKIGLMGHSLGGEASAAVGRERRDIGAVIDLDADLGGEYLGFANGKPVINDQPYPAPILIMYSDELVRRFAGIADLNNVVASKRVAATAPHAYEVNFTGTNHMSLTDLPLVSPVLVTLINSSFQSVGGHEADAYTVIEKMNGLVLEFFNAYLKGEGSFTSAGTY
jgi:dienelactone hydrolase